MNIPLAITTRFSSQHHTFTFKSTPLKKYRPLISNGVENPSVMQSAPSHKELQDFQRQANDAKFPIIMPPYKGQKSKLIQELKTSLAKTNSQRTKDDWLKIAIFWADVASKVNGQNALKRIKDPAEALYHCGMTEAMDLYLAVHIMLEKGLINDSNKAIIVDNYLSRWAPIYGHTLTKGNELQEFKAIAEGYYVFPPDDYKPYSVSANRIDRYTNIPSILNRLASRGDLIADFGAGNGGVSSDLIDMRFNLIGIDPSSRIIPSPYGKKHPDRLIQGYFEDPKLKELVNQKHDKAKVALFLTSLITYANSKEEFDNVLKHAKDYLRPDGYIVIRGIESIGLPMQFNLTLEGSPIFPSMTPKKLKQFLVGNKDFQLYSLDYDTAILKRTTSN